MNYFEIIQKVLQELKYPQVSTFANLTNPEHLQIKSLINVVNRDVLLGAGYNVRNKVASLNIPAETEDKYTIVANTINGEIKRNGVIVNEENYTYINDISNFYKGNIQEYNYTIFGSDLYFGSSKNARTANILYLTYNFAQDSEAVGKSNMTDETDTSIIPDDLIEAILVYGACFTFKGSNSADSRMAFWLEQYKNGVASLNGYSGSEDLTLTLSVATNNDLRRGIV